MALGGEAGARFAARLRLPTSPSTLLRLVRAAPRPQTPALQAVGVDEWAWRRGHRYGTILVNLADHRVVDLLPDRSATSVAAWLAQHPTITVVCRDRSDLYADGIRRGAPEAVQVVDRFHLVQNLRQAEVHASPYTRPQGPSARAVSFVMVCPAAHRSDDAQRYLDQLCQVDAHIARAHGLSQAFLAMVRERRGTDLEAWMAEAMHSGIEELARFARGLQEDLTAVTAGLTLEWSNGVTEGQVHRLKLVKRQGYGRAGFALLRQRLLHAA
jgi:transposase